MTAIRYKEPALEPDRQGLFDGLRFLDQRERVEDHTATDHAFHARLKNPGWNQMEDVPLVSDVDGVPRVVSALITCDAVEFLRENVDDLALSLIAPLDAYNCEIVFH